jgi:hypothetical protein
MVFNQNDFFSFCVSFWLEKYMVTLSIMAAGVEIVLIYIDPYILTICVCERKKRLRTRAYVVVVRKAAVLLFPCNLSNYIGRAVWTCVRESRIPWIGKRFNRNESLFWDASDKLSVRFLNNAGRIIICVF